MHLPNFQYLAPKNAAELSALLAEHGASARILSGGTDLLVQMKSPGMRPDYLIDITGLEELSKIKFDDGAGLVIGGVAKLEAVMDTPVVKEKYRGLWQSIETIGARQIRTMGSLGGNLCNASPAADTPPALVALGAEVTIASAEGDRSILLEDFILGNRQTALVTGEYLKTITLPVPTMNSGSAYHHFRVRGGMEIAMAAVAAYLELDAKAQAITDAKIVLGVVGPAPIRATGAEQMLIGQKPDETLLQSAAQRCADQSRPIDDYRASAEYRREILKVLFERTFDDAFTNAAR